MDECFFLVPAYPGSPGPKAAKRLCVCVCVLLMYLLLLLVILTVTMIKQYRIAICLYSVDFYF